MADGFIQVPADSTGKRLDTTELTVAASSVHRERLVIAGDAATELADVKSSVASSSHFGLVTREAMNSTTTVLGSAALLAGTTANTIGAVAVVEGSSAIDFGVIMLSTGFGIAAIDPRQATIVGATSGAVLWTVGAGSSGVTGTSLISTGLTGAAIDPRLVTLQAGSTATLIGTVNLSSQAGGTTTLDSANEAWRVNVVAGGAGGGVADLQVRSTANAWTDIGFFTGNFIVPVGITTAVGSTTIIDPRAASLTASSSQTFPVQLSTAPNTAYIDARQATIVAATSGTGLGVILSTAAGSAAIDPRLVTLQAGTTALVGAVAFATVSNNVSLWSSSGVNITGSTIAPTSAGMGLFVRLVHASSDLTNGTIMLSTAFGTAAIDARQSTIVGATSGAGLGTIVSTGAGAAAIDPRQVTVVAGTSGTAIGTLQSTGAGGAAIDPRILSTGGGPLRVYGDVSTGSTAGVNPIGIGGRISTANPTTAADGGRAFFMTDAVGRQITVASHVRGMTISTGVTITTTSETSILAAAGSSVYHDLTFLSITNRSTANVVRVVLSASSGSGSSGYNFTLAERGGIVMPFNPPLYQQTANSAWCITIVSGASTVDVSVQAVKNVPS